MGAAALFFTLLASCLFLLAPALPFNPSDAVSAPSGKGCTLSVPTYGTLTGVAIEGACRFAVKYGQADRWATSAYPQNLTVLDRLPPSCPQSPNYAIGQEISEDCLYATIYTPPTSGLSPKSGLPVFVWVHGGSFTAGGASAPGLVGSNLALKGGMIVVVLQYRLGVLGFLPPPAASTAADPNLGVQDVILALRGVKKYIQHAGGDPGKVVVGGQSSGAHLLRALWAAPDAKGLFRGAILQSDPMFYGLAPPATTAQLRTAYYTLPSLNVCTTLACLKALPVDTLLAGQAQLTQSAPFTIPGVPLGEPIRPTFNTPTLPSDPSALLFSSPGKVSSPPSTIPLLLTTTHNEAGSITQSLFPSPIPLSAASATYISTLNLLLGPERAGVILNSTEYAFPTNTSSPGADAFRETFERLVTDGIWRCAVRQVGKRWAGAGGKVWLGEWTKGVGYGPNAQAGGYCSTPGRVCHEDDIFPTFGTAPSPSASVSALEDQVSTAWISFIHSLDPNAKVTLSKRDCPLGPGAGVATGIRALSPRWKLWTPGSDSGDVLSLGSGSGSGSGDVGSCPAGFWGQKVLFDWQVWK